jgi:hypothetical protein
MAVNPEVVKKWETDGAFRSAVLDDPFVAARDAGLTLNEDDRVYLRDRARTGKLLRSAYQLREAMRDEWTNLDDQGKAYVQGLFPGISEASIVRSVSSDLSWCGVPPGSA